MKSRTRVLIERFTCGLVFAIATASPLCHGQADARKAEPNVELLATAYIQALQVASAQFEKEATPDLEEKKMLAEFLVAQIFRLWMSEKDSLHAYPKNFFKRARFALEGALVEIGLDSVWTDPLRSVINSYKGVPLINQEFGRPPHAVFLSQFIEKPEIYRKCVSDFLSDLGLDATGKPIPEK